MLDHEVRTRLRPALDVAAAWLSQAGVSAQALTAVGLLLGVGSAVAAGAAAWSLALALWLLSRVADGLDGPVARHRGGGTDRGGYLDVVADFAVYGAFVFGCAVGRPDARIALFALLLAYYVNGTAFLALSSIVERRAQRTGLEDERSFVFVRGIAEGTETIVVHAAMVLFPAAMAMIASAFAVAVAITVVQRVALAVRLLGSR